MLSRSPFSRRLSAAGVAPRARPIWWADSGASAGESGARSVSTAVLAWCWHVLVRRLSGDEIVAWPRSLDAYARSWLVKYLPGNVFHLAGRQAVAAAHGYAHDSRGVALYRLGRVDAAFRARAKAIACGVRHADSLRFVAWILATHRDPKQRDAARALAYARARGIHDDRIEATIRHACAYMLSKELDEVDVTAARVGELGGNVVHPPTDIPNVGRFAVVADTAGAIFGIITLNQAPPETA